MRCFSRLTLDRRADFGFAFQFVPQHVDFVQHRDMVIGVPMHVLLPDFQIGARHARVGCQHKNHRVRTRNHRERQLRLGAQRIQPGGVEYRQARLQQRMRKIHQRIAPHRNFHCAIGLQTVPVVGIILIPQSQCDGFGRGHLLGFGELAQTFLDLPGIGRIKLHPAPLHRHMAQMRERLRTRAGFDR